MACLFPVGCYRKTGELALRPCGQCITCRLEYSRDWALRCVHESMMHEKNCFVTLTYNNENLPDDKSIDKKELQLLFRKMRETHDIDFRYFACGEYGETSTLRPHYHICIFGYDFDDKIPFGKNNRRLTKWQGKYKVGPDHTLYTSEFLEKTLWKKGFCTIGELTFETAAYVARYVTKKIKGTSDEAERMRKERYGDKKTPEFALMSRMPGIGKTWLDLNHTNLYPKDFVTLNGKKYRAPRYYDTQYGKMYPERFDKIKQNRLEKTKVAFPEDRDSINRNRYREKMNKIFRRDKTNESK